MFALGLASPILSIPTFSTHLSEWALSATQTTEPKKQLGDILDESLSNIPLLSAGTKMLSTGSYKYLFNWPAFSFA